MRSWRWLPCEVSHRDTENTESLQLRSAQQKTDMTTIANLKRSIGLKQHYVGLCQNPEQIAGKIVLMRKVLNTFAASFNAQDRREVHVHFVPGRVEFLGKHTDYAGGHSIVMAVDRGFFAISARNGTNAVRMAECDNDSGVFPSAAFGVSPRLEHAPGDWTNYPKTMVQRIALNFARSAKLEGVDIAFGCDLPVGGGMSGSSALMIMTYLALAGANHLQDSKKYQRNIRDGLDLATYLACCENGQTFRELTGHKGVGTFGGSEDHTEILNGKRGMLSVFQFCPTVHKADLAWRDNCALAICYSGVRAEKTRAAMADYNQASERARLVVAAYNRQYTTNDSLMREIIDENPARGLPHLLDRVAFATRKSLTEDDLPGRFRQFYVEDREIIPKTAAAWIRADCCSLGRLVDLSHRNSKKYLRNIVPEIHFLQRSARRLGALASSGFGAGFGGSVYALMQKDGAADFLRQWKETYTGKFPQPAAESEFLLTTPAGCAQEMFVDGMVHP